MDLYIYERKVKAPTLGEPRETRIYALSTVVKKIGANGEELVDLQHSTIHDWSSTLSWKEFCQKMAKEGHKCV